MALGIKHSPVSLFYLNDYPHSVPRFRIESTPGGQLTRWKARTTMQKMEETKRYLERCWGVTVQNG